jgi:exportin-1
MISYKHGNTTCTIEKVANSFLMTYVVLYDIFLQQKMAQQVLTTLKEHPDAWTRVDTILEYSSNQQTKYYALQILENVIKTRWKVLPRAQCEGEVKII